jgi:hypothetical protein
MPFSQYSDEYHDSDTRRRTRRPVHFPNSGERAWSWVHEYDREVAVQHPDIDQASEDGEDEDEKVQLQNPTHVILMDLVGARCRYKRCDEGPKTEGCQVAKAVAQLALFGSFIRQHLRWERRNVDQETDAGCFDGCK